MVDYSEVEHITDRRVCLPAYVVLDTSEVMRPYEQLLNDNVIELIEALLWHSEAQEFIRLSIIGFSSTAQLVWGMNEAVDSVIAPRISCGGNARYRPMLKLVHDRIEADIPALSVAGLNVLRPFAVFLTDGAPADGSADSWAEELARLADPSWSRRPQTIAYGFTAASESIVEKISTLAAFVASDPMMSKQQALASALTSVLRSLLASSQRRRLQIPQEVAGFKSVPVRLLRQQPDHLDRRPRGAHLSHSPVSPHGKTRQIK